MSTLETRDIKKKKVAFSIREMQIDDLAVVFHLGERLFTAREVPNLYRTWDEYEVVSLFQTDSEFCLVAESEEGQIIGFALGTTVIKSHSAWKYGYLIWLGIDPDVHVQGVGTRLFNKFKEIMLENGTRMLLVDSEADNLPALYFFRKMGFAHPQEHIYLSLNLDPELREFREKKASPRSSSRYQVDEDD